MFKINRSDFEEKSEVFREMFEVPSGQKRTDGSCVEQPLLLPGVSAPDMILFLRVLFKRS